MGGDIDSLPSCKVYIRNVKSGKYIENVGNVLSDGWILEICEWDGNEEQIWDIWREESGYYSIHSSTDSHYVLAVEGNSNASGANIIMKYVSDVKSPPRNALFKFDNPNFSGATYLISKLSESSSNKQAISCQNGNTEDETFLVTETKSNSLDTSAHQLWVFEDLDRSIKINNWNLVDINKHCDWASSVNGTKYASMIATATEAWNNSRFPDVFRKDDWIKIKDVEIKTLATDPQGKGAYGCTYSKDYKEGPNNDTSKAKTIELYLDKLEILESDLQRQKIITHELGHALGLAHNNEAEGSIMTQGSLPYGISFSRDDIESFEASYNEYGLF